MRRWHLTVGLAGGAAVAVWLASTLDGAPAPEAPPVVTQLPATFEPIAVPPPPPIPELASPPAIPVVPLPPAPPVVALPPDPPPKLYASCAGLTTEPVDCGRG